jgi:energy-coupling factor transport system permease protein
MISSLLTSSSRPSELTYGMEFYLKPLKFTGVDTHEIALMMSIAIRFVPTLLEEADRIMKAQTSRGADFEHGKLVDKMSATTSLIVPLFMSCFEKSVDLSEAMVVRGYGIGKRSEYPRKKNIFLDTVVIIVIVLFIVSLFVINGVI